MIQADLPIVEAGKTLLDGLKVIESTGECVALVVNSGVLVGIMTDGDARRAILGGCPLDVPIVQVMQKQFLAVSQGIERIAALDLMKARGFTHLPVVGDNNKLIGLHTLKELLSTKERLNAALIFCGGFGTRLRPITEKIPKPMVLVAGRPILEHILMHLIGGGIRKFYFAVHYRYELIEEYFGDGSKFGCSIEYLIENKPLGTGGALALLPSGLPYPLVVMNGDLISPFDVASLIDFHDSSSSVATVGVTTYVHDVPFGVLDLDGTRLVSIQEKPKISLPVGAGIYVIDPKVAMHLVPGHPISMPDILEGCIRRGEKVSCHFISQEWQDVGNPSQLRAANGA